MENERNGEDVKKKEEKELGRERGLCVADKRGLGMSGYSSTIQQQLPELEAAHLCNERTQHFFPILQTEKAELRSNCYC